MSLLFFSAAAFKSTICAAEKESLYDRVMRTGTVRVGYSVYNPIVIKDPNTGNLSGIGIDAFKKAAENLQLKAEFVEEVPWGSMIEGLISDRYDVILYLWVNSTRARMVDFSIPLLYSPVYAYARPDDHRFDSGLNQAMKDSSIKIAAIDGEMSAIIAKADYPDHATEQLPQNADVSQMLLTVSTKKADVYFGEPNLVLSFLAHNKDAVKNVTPNKPLRIFGNTVMFKRNEMEFKNMLNRALEELLNSGYIDQLIKKYEPFPGSLYPIALPYRTNS